MGPDAMILVSWTLSLKPTFSLSSLTFIKRLFSSSSLSAIRVVSSAYLRLLILLTEILIPTCASSSPVFLMMYSAYKLNRWLLAEFNSCSSWNWEPSSLLFPGIFPLSLFFSLSLFYYVDLSTWKFTSLKLIRESICWKLPSPLPSFLFRSIQIILTHKSRALHKGLNTWMLEKLGLLEFVHDTLHVILTWT